MRCRAPPDASLCDAVECPFFRTDSRPKAKSTSAGKRENPQRERCDREVGGFIRMACEFGKRDRTAVKAHRSEFGFYSFLCTFPENVLSKSGIRRAVFQAGRSVLAMTFTRKNARRKPRRRARREGRARGLASRKDGDQSSKGRSAKHVLCIPQDSLDLHLNRLRRFSRPRFPGRDTSAAARRARLPRDAKLCRPEDSRANDTAFL